MSFSMSRFLRIAAWLALLALLFVTISPIELRPSIGRPNVERFIVLAIVAGLFVIAYPQRPFRVMILLWVTAVGFELLQFVADGRHPGLRDVAFKCAGAAAGVAFGLFIHTARMRAVRPLKQT
jgi:hypothetical protein